MVAAAKLPVLNPDEFKLWKMRIKRHFLMTDCALWEIIVNGDSPPPKRTVDGVEQTYPPITAEEKLEKKNELKAKDGYVNHEIQKIPKEDWKENWALRENRNREPVRRNMTVETTDAKALVAQDGIGNFMPPKPDLILADVDEYVSESVTSVPAIATNKAKISESKPKSVSKPLIEDWVSDSEDENENETKSK
uniref:Uncharacterized protein n=1 Tax=Tanacetum cinerariifolium TaxID=118510 RepID=A0A699GRL0_TANCI|nr:hypothetical protein [Tanacetum cinerariifolium]